MPEYIGLSPERLIYGTMRMGEVTRSVTEWSDFLISVHALGITKLHSSSEYESFPLLCEILQHLAQCEDPLEFTHIAKLAEPSFDDADFDAGRLEQKIDAYRKALGSECIHDVQWMWRQNLNDDAGRIEQFEQALAAIAPAIAALKSAGKIGRFLCFPYSVDFAQAAIASEIIDGLAVYRNTDETEYDPLIQSCADIGKTVLVIRPLNAGKVLSNESIPAASHVQMALDMPAIEAGIISSNSLDHIRELLA